MRWVFIVLSIIPAGIAVIDFIFHDWRAVMWALGCAMLPAFSAWRRWTNIP
jgi:hypothetical protein